MTEERATEKQVAYIESLAQRQGLVVNTEGLTKARASFVIKGLKQGGRFARQWGMPQVESGDDGHAYERNYQAHCESSENLPWNQTSDL